MIARLAIAVLAGLLFAACGSEDPPKHGLESERLASTPTGEAIEVVYGAADGSEYVARVTIRMQFQQTQAGSTPKAGEGRAVVEIHQRFKRPDPKRPSTSRITFQYKEAEGVKADAYLKRELVTGTIEHEANGRPKPHSLRLEGGTKSEQIEVRDLLGALMMAGFGGSPSWMPPRAVRQGEAWQLETFVKPRALEDIALQARRVGLQVPQPTFSGTARLEKVIDDGRSLEVSIDALLELEGDISQKGETGHISIGDRVRGRAVISAATGLPVSFQVTHSGIKRIQAGGGRIDQTFTSELEGRVERLKGK